MRPMARRIERKRVLVKWKMRKQMSEIVEISSKWWMKHILRTIFGVE